MFSKRSQVQSSTFPPGRRPSGPEAGLGKKLKVNNGNPRKKCGFCHIIANATPIFRLGVTKPGVFHINTPSKWSLDTRIQPLNP